MKQLLLGCGLISMGLSYIRGKNFYELLEVKPGATEQDIEQAYARLSQIYDPNSTYRTEVLKVPLTDFEVEAFKLMTAAYVILKDSIRRNEYNRSLGISFENHSNNGIDEVTLTIEDSKATLTLRKFNNTSVAPQPNHLSTPTLLLPAPKQYEPLVTNSNGSQISSSKTSHELPRATQASNRFSQAETLSHYSSKALSLLKTKTDGARLLYKGLQGMLSYKEKQAKDSKAPLGQVREGRRAVVYASVPQLRSGRHNLKVADWFLLFCAFGLPLIAIIVAAIWIAFLAQG